MYAYRQAVGVGHSGLEVLGKGDGLVGVGGVQVRQVGVTKVLCIHV